MKYIRMKRRDSIQLSPGELYGLPDNIAAQAIKRGSGAAVDDPAGQPDRVEEAKPKAKNKKSSGK